MPTRPAEFNAKFHEIAGQLFPDRPMGGCADHPIYSCLHRIECMKFPADDGPWQQINIRSRGKGFLMG